MNINDYEKVLNLEMGIPNVSLSFLTVEQANKFTEALKMIFEKYPNLKNSLCAIGDTESINNQMNLISFSMNPNAQQEDPVCKENSLMSLNYFHFSEKIASILRMLNIPILEFAGICFEKNLNESDERILKEIKGLLEKYKNLPMVFNIDDEIINDLRFKRDLWSKNTENIKGLVYHEIGHLLDLILGISNSREFNQILSYKEWDIGTEIGFQACLSLKELVAEAFAEYIVNPNPSELVVLLGQLIDSKYAKSKKNIFNINYKYKYFLEKASFEMTR